MSLSTLRKPWPASEFPGLPSLSSVRDEMNRLLDGMFLRPFSAPAMAGPVEGASWIPAIDLAETDSEIQVRAELPGVAPQDVDVSVTGERLVISGEKKIAKESQGNGWMHRESACGVFGRTLTLPESVDPEKVSAKYENGVLIVTMAKQPAGKARRIPVACA